MLCGAFACASDDVDKGESGAEASMAEAGQGTTDGRATGTGAGGSSGTVTDASDSSGPGAASSEGEPCGEYICDQATVCVPPIEGSGETDGGEPECRLCPNHPGCEDQIILKGREGDCAGCGKVYCYWEVQRPALRDGECCYVYKGWGDTCWEG